MDYDDLPQRRIEVSNSALPATIAAALRYVLALAIPFAISQGYISEGSTEAVIGLVTMGATIAYGLWQTYRTKRDLVTTAKAAPPDVAVVK